MTARLTAGPGSDQLKALETQFRQQHGALSAELALLRAKCGAALPQDNAELVVRDSLDGVAAMPDLAALAEGLARSERFHGRLAASGIAGAAVGTVLAKFGLSSAFDLAAKALAKLAGKKATSVGAGILGGGVLGGAGGSFVPGAGTGVGAVVGGVIGGIAIAVGVDFLALKLEEEIAREAFAADLYAAVAASEAAFQARLAPAPRTETEAEGGLAEPEALPAQ